MDEFCKQSFTGSGLSEKQNVSDLHVRQFKCCPHDLQHLFAFGDNFLILQLEHAQLGKLIFIFFSFLTRFLQLFFNGFQLSDISLIDNDQRYVPMSIQDRYTGT